jgi:hypothetical protein
MDSVRRYDSNTFGVAGDFFEENPPGPSSVSGIRQRQPRFYDRIRIQREALDAGVD